MKYRKYLLTFLFALLFPLNIYAYSNKLIASGRNIGIEVNGEGVLVVGFYKNEPKASGMEIGDIIKKTNDNSVLNANDIEKNIKEGNNNFEIERDGKKFNINVDLNKENNIVKTGIYVKDKVTGIGTLTFIDPETRKFGALGHEIDDSITKRLFEIRGGTIFKSSIVGINKSERGEAGSKRAVYDKSDINGTILKNDKNGIFGTYDKAFNESDAIEVASPKTGHAIIRTEVDNNVKDYSVNILNINKNGDRNILFTIDDDMLLSKTGGIVQGMSGSPILQDGKFIGAVTHVIVDDPKKGYGIDIKNMLNNSN